MRFLDVLKINVLLWSKVYKTRHNRSYSPCYDLFMDEARKMNNPRVLELGVKRSTDISTMHKYFVPNAGEYIGTDIETGIDVDVIADVHKLSSVFGEESFDIIISCSTFEHFKYPQLAAHEIMKTLKLSGLLLVQSHQSYYLHAYPYDYCRFSKEALSGLFGNEMGFSVLMAGYEYPVQIVSPQEPSICKHDAFSNVVLVGKKIAQTPQNYIYEL